jgi:hypothetical protein
MSSIIASSPASRSAGTHIGHELTVESWIAPSHRFAALYLIGENGAGTNMRLSIFTTMSGDYLR